MVQPTERMFALAERGLPIHHRAGHITGTVPGAGEPLLIYTDGSVTGEPILAAGLGWMTGWGYIATNGRFGCGKTPQFAKAGDDISAVAELRAIWYGIDQRADFRPCTVYTDSLSAVKIITAWKGGSTRMPPGYTGRAAGTNGRRVATLEQLRRAVAAHPDNITIEHTKGHAGDLLNEAADTLARLGMRWGRDALTKPQVRDRARNIAEGFLTQWRCR